MKTTATLRTPHSLRPDAPEPPPPAPCVRAGRPLLGAFAAALLLLATGCAGNQGKAKTASEGGTASAAGEASGGETGGAGEEGTGSTTSGKAEPSELPRTKSMAEALADIYAQTAKGAGKNSPSSWNKATAAPQPPDGKWLEDDEGRKYFVVEIPKIEGQYLRTGKNSVRLAQGVPLDLAGETKDTFLVKIYQVEPFERPRRHKPTPEEIAQVAASFKADLPSSDRLVFSDFGHGLPQKGQWRNGFAVADMNRDGHPDIVHGARRRAPSPPSIFLGDGHGSWHAWEGLSFPTAPYQYGDVATADFNGDGREDIALAEHLSGLGVLVAHRHGFEMWSRGLELVPPGQATKSTFLSRTIAADDWDGDGRPDLIALSEGPRPPKKAGRAVEEKVDSPAGVAIYRNEGDGSWTVLARPGADEGVFGDSLALGDFDGDGRRDLVVSTSALGKKKLLFLNRGAGAPEAVQIAALRPSALVWSVAAADFDGDGLADLAASESSRQVGEWWTSLDVLLTRKAKDGTLTFERHTLHGGRDVETDRLTSLAAGDVDGDGRADLVGATDDGRVLVFLGDGHGGFTQEATPELGEPRPGCRGYHTETVDLDGDGVDEVIVGFAGEECPTGGNLGAWKAAPK